MPNQQLVDYINQCLAANQTKEQIKQSLLSAGWQEGDVDEALVGASSSVAIPITPSLLQDQSASNQIKYAGFWIRYIALSIDSLILTLAINVLPLILGFIFGNIFIILILRVVGLLFVPIYLITMTYKRQATIGKKLANLTVISDKAENLTLWQVILRETIGKIVSSIFFIGYIMAGFTQRKQGLHDKIAKTAVIYKDPNKKVSIWVIILGILVPVIMIGIIFLSIPFALFGALRNSDKTINISVEEKIKNDIFNKIINEQEKKNQLNTSIADNQNFNSEATSVVSSQYDSFARCLAEKNITIYCTDWSPHCQNEKNAFGESWKYVSYIDCSKDAKLCLDKKVIGYPTWVWPDGKKLIGEQGLEKLSKESGCRLP